MNNKPFAEIIAGSLNTWKAQCWHWDNFPVFGAPLAITTNNRTLYGIVTGITTGSSDPQRVPLAYQKTEVELRRDHPHIFSFLQTTFECLIIGYKEDGIFYYQWAPQPPKIHAFVYEMLHEDMQAFFSNNHYLNVLFGSNQSLNLDELLLALVTNLKKHGLMSPESLTEFIEIFSLLTGNDYKRLKLFLQRAQRIL